MRGVSVQPRDGALQGVRPPGVLRGARGAVAEVPTLQEEDPVLQHSETKELETWEFLFQRKTEGYPFPSMIGSLCLFGGNREDCDNTAFDFLCRELKNSGQISRRRPWQTQLCFQDISSVLQRAPCCQKMLKTIPSLLAFFIFGYLGARYPSPVLRVKQFW